MKKKIILDCVYLLIFHVLILTIMYMYLNSKYYINIQYTHYTYLLYIYNVYTTYKVNNTNNSNTYLLYACIQ